MKITITAFDFGRKTEQQIWFSLPPREITFFEITYLANFFEFMVTLHLEAIQCNDSEDYTFKGAGLSWSFQDYIDLLKLKSPV